MAQQREQLQNMVPPLLDWFRDNARVLPWRSDPQPYKVWVSEIMLQQTRVAAVLGYFARFLDRLPTVDDLAKVEEDELLKLWQGLGYYNRARNLQKAARQIMSDFGGIFPSSYEEIIKLSGVGDYTAGAIASIAFGEAVPAVDGNVLRVITRVTGDRSDIGKPETKANIRASLLEVIPTAFPGQFNQALMELGALVCLPNGAPLCESCPLKELCKAHLEGLTDQIPVKEKKKARRVEERTVCLIFREGKVALRQRPKKGLLAGLWEFPHFLEGEDCLKDWALAVEKTEEGCAAKHIFTHIEWHMSALRIYLKDDRLPPGWVWADARELDEIYAVPNAFSGFREEVAMGLRGSRGEQCSPGGTGCVFA